MCFPSMHVLLLLKVFAATVKMIIFVYVRACAFVVVSERRGAVGLLWSGVAIRCGSLSGSVIIHVINVVLHPFQRLPPCPGM